MTRIAGIDIPDNKPVQVSLTYIYGLGLTSSQKILAAANITPTTRVKDLTEDELTRVRQEITANYQIEGDLAQQVRLNIARLKDIDSYRGQRHKASLPLRGQRTRTNARTKRGKRATVGSGRKAAPAPK